MAEGSADILTPKQHEVILALLSESSVARAAAKADVPERTLYRWLGEPAFGKAYRDARRESYGQSIALVQRYATMAVNTFAKIMSDTNAPPQARVAAASAVLKFGREGIELDDLAARVEALEQATDKDKPSWRYHSA